MRIVTNSAAEHPDRDGRDHGRGGITRSMRLALLIAALLCCALPQAASARKVEVLADAAAHGTGDAVPAGVKRRL